MRLLQLKRLGLGAVSMVGLLISLTASGQTLETATFAGGCFWCMEPPFEKLDGVVSVTAGYMGGEVVSPTYEAVSSGETGHAEVVQVIYDSEQISYPALLDVFWVNIDPTVANQQFCDVGNQYRSAIFYHSETQKALSEASKAEWETSGRFGQIATQVVPASTFYPAEAYHQDYYRNNPVRYHYYRYRCGRDKRLEQLWGSTP